MSSGTDRTNGTNFRVTSDMIIGGRSKFDEVFLPISDTSCLKSQDHGRNYSSHRNTDFVEEESEETTHSPLDQLLPNSTRDSEKSTRCYHASISSVIVIALILLLVIFGHQYIKNILIWIESEDIEVGCTIFLVLYILVSFPIAWGYILLMIAAGYLYGYLYGPLLVVCCASVGLFISNLVMRSCCRQCFMAKFYSEKVASVISVVESDQGFKVIALTRLTPIPFGLQNGLFALADINIFKYWMASVLGLLPMAFLNCYMGSTLRSMDDVMTDESNQLTAYLIFGGQIVIAVGLLMFVVRKARVELKIAVDSIIPPTEDITSKTTSDFYINMDNEHT